MRIIIFLSLMATLVSCASNRARQNVSYDKITINGGVYRDKEWKDKLVFNRITTLRDTWAKKVETKN